MIVRACFPTEVAAHYEAMNARFTPMVSVFTY